jgi:hypothetical protein
MMNSVDGKMVEGGAPTFDGQRDHPDDEASSLMFDELTEDRLSVMAAEYSQLLDSQLHSQREHYEAAMQASAAGEVGGEGEALQETEAALRSASEESRSRLAAARYEEGRLQKRHAAFTDKLAALAEENEFLQEINLSLRHNESVWAADQGGIQGRLTQDQMQRSGSAASSGAGSAGGVGVGGAKAKASPEAVNAQLDEQLVALEATLATLMERLS